MKNTYPDLLSKDILKSPYPSNRADYQKQSYMRQKMINDSMRFKVGGVLKTENGTIIYSGDNP